MNNEGVYVFSAPLTMASTESLGDLPANSNFIPRIRGLIHQASNVSHDVGDGIHASRAGVDGAARPLTTLGASLSGALHSTLQQSMAEEGSDPFMVKLQHDRPEEWLKHEHDMQTADLAMQTLSAFFGAIEQQGLR
jgi:hypothetical protein